MEPVISPALIYLIHMIKAIYGLSIFILFVSAFTMVMSPLIADCVCEDYEEEGKVMRKIIKICAILVVICIILIMFIPNEKTIYAMITASMITPDNISITEDHITELISKIAEAVKNQ